MVYDCVLYCCDGVMAGMLRRTGKKTCAQWFFCGYPTQFKWFAGYAGWGPRQLMQECQRGVWFTAAASPQLLIQPTGSGSAADDSGERDPSSGKDYWHKVCQNTRTAD